MSDLSQPLHGQTAGFLEGEDAIYAPAPLALAGQSTILHSRTLSGVPGRNRTPKSGIRLSHTVYSWSTGLRPSTRVLVSLGMGASGAAQGKRNDGSTTKLCNIALRRHKTELQ
jgi:hypothetical protein